MCKCEFALWVVKSYMTVEQNLNLIQIIKSENLIFTIILTLKQEQMKRKLCLTFYWNTCALFSTVPVVNTHIHWLNLPYLGHKRLLVLKILLVLCLIIINNQYNSFPFNMLKQTCISLDTNMLSSESCIRYSYNCLLSLNYNFNSLP